MNIVLHCAYSQKSTRVFLISAVVHIIWNSVLLHLQKVSPRASRGTWRAEEASTGEHQWHDSSQSVGAPRWAGFCYWWYSLSVLNSVLRHPVRLNRSTWLLERTVHLMNWEAVERLQFVPFACCSDLSHSCSDFWADAHVHSQIQFCTVRSPAKMAK